MESQTNPNNPVVETEHPSDKLDKTRTIYDASSTEIMWKNFLAGLMRGFGSVLVWFFFMIIMINLFLYIAWPQLKPYTDQYLQALDTITQMNQSTATSNDPGLDMEAVNNALQQLQLSQ